MCWEPPAHKWFDEAELLRVQLYSSDPVSKYSALKVKPIWHLGLGSQEKYPLEFMYVMSGPKLTTWQDQMEN